MSHDYYAIPISDFFKLAVSVDCVIFGHEGKKLKVLLIQRGAKPYLNQWALPGDLVYPNEALDTAALRILKGLTSLDKIFFEQVAVFGDPLRHPLGRVVTTGYLALVEMKDYMPKAASWAQAVEWHDINNLPELAFDHMNIISTSLKKLQEMARHKPLGRGVLPEKFTITELQELYEAIYNSNFDKGNFRKKVLEWNYFIDSEEFQKNVPHRPARIFSFNDERYDQLEQLGFSFDL